MYTYICIMCIYIYIYGGGHLSEFCERSPQGNLGAHPPRFDSKPKCNASYFHGCCAAELVTHVSTSSLQFVKSYHEITAGWQTQTKWNQDYLCSPTGHTDLTAVSVLCELFPAGYQIGNHFSLLRTMLIFGTPICGEISGV